MKITPLLFEAFLKCSTKCFLLAHDEPPTGNPYADWLHSQQAAYQKAGVERFRARFANADCIAGDLSSLDLKAGEWRLACDIPIETDTMQSCLHAIENTPAAGDMRGEIIPIRFVFGKRPKSLDKLLLAFDAFVLSHVLGRPIGIGKIICGDEYTPSRLKPGPLFEEVQKVTTKALASAASSSAPELVLNRHCPECPYQSRCRQKALEVDDLSLFPGMSPEEREKHRRRGIFTVKQLSYTFRPRRRPKKARLIRQPHYYALQALAIRENTVYLNGIPQLPPADTKVFLDIEGLSPSGPYYLLGALVERHGQEEFRSFWSENPVDELLIFTQFIEYASELPNLRVFHFGSYDATALKMVRSRLPEGLKPKLDMILQKATNVLSVVYSHIYFPTYSNGLKDIGKCLGCERTTEHLSGFQSIIVRKTWEQDHNPETKASLIRYNREDCFALRRLCEFIDRIASLPPTGEAKPGVARAEDIRGDKSDYQVNFAPKKYADENLSYVNKCAYFDYQREKVVFRTHPHLRSRKRPRGGIDLRKLRPNKTITLEKERCPTCQGRRIRRQRLIHFFLLDLRFSKTGVRRFVTKFSSWSYWCLKCRYPFTARGARGNRLKFGRSLLVWCVYSNVLCCQSLGQIARSSQDLFGVPLQPSTVSRAKRRLAKELRPLYDEILGSLLQGPLLHADETQVRLVEKKGYVWVFTSMDRCYFFYRPNREGEFLPEMLKSFSGVLVSDFYSAYDSLPCAQQKCLAHFVRDIDDDLLKNPLDQDLKVITQEFGTLLKEIIQTVDRYGLRKFHLHKHKKAVTGFLSSVAAREFSSELATSYQERFEKSGAKMFTFLDYDGIPWNNNNAEHAIKRFAKYRRSFDGYFTETSLQEYLVLASIFATCEFNNVNVLQFLLSGERTLAGLLSMGRRKASVSKEQPHPVSSDGSDIWEDTSLDQADANMNQAGT